MTVAGLARRMWLLLEPYHAVVYYAPEARQSLARAYEDSGWGTLPGGALGSSHGDVVVGADDQPAVRCAGRSRRGCS
jgi:hypothetical protein